MNQRLKERISACLVCAAGGLSLWEAGKLYRFRAGFLIGDHVFPGLVGLGLIVCGLFLLRRPVRRRAEEEGERPKSDLRRVASIPFILSGYALLLPWAGFMIGTFAAAALLFRTVGAYPWGKCLLGALLVTASMELVFVQWLNTPLPSGKIDLM